MAFAEGEFDDELCAFALLAVDVDGAVVEVDDFAGEGEADAGAFVGVVLNVVRLEEAVEDVFQLVFGDAGAGVFDGDADKRLVGRMALGVIGDGDGDVAAGGGEFDGVHQEVVEHVLHFTGVEVEMHPELGVGEFQGDAFLFRHVLEGGDCVLDEGDEVLL